MQRKQQKFLLCLSTLPLFIIIPITLLLLYPKAIALASNLACYLFLFAVVVLFVFPLRQKTLQNPHQKPLSTFGWISSIVGIELLVTFLFIGQFYTLSLWLAHYQLIPKQANHWFVQNSLHLFEHWSLFPWSFLAFATLCFNRQASHHKTSSALAVKTSGKKKTIPPIFRHLLNFYPSITATFIVCLSLAFISVQISFIIFPSYHPMFNILYGTTTCFFIMLITRSKVLVKIFTHMKNQKLAPTVNFIFQTITITVILIAISLVMAKFDSHTEKIGHQWPPFRVFSKQHIGTIINVWFFSWWILASPLISSLLSKISHGKNARITIAIILLFPFLIITSLHFLPAPSSVAPIVIYCFQFIAFGGICLLFAKKQDNQLLWAGYISQAPVKKLRAPDTRLIWLVTAALLGLFTLSGIESLVLISFTCCIGVITFIVSLMDTRS